MSAPMSKEAIKVYVRGIGWCWMEDGEIIEVISDD